ncbi:MAG: hypothetical protein ACJAQ6_000637 [Arenicella sp.]|jgi:hypothetical protein
MTARIDISEIQLKQLDTSSIALISKFAISLQKHNGKFISLRDECALKKVVYEAKKTDSAELREIYVRLKSALKTHFNSKQGHNFIALNSNANGTQLQHR